jgi:hypothetical protein
VPVDQRRLAGAGDRCQFMRLRHAWRPAVTQSAEPAAVRRAHAAGQRRLRPDRLLLRLTVARRLASVALHPVCSVHHAGTQDKLRAIAAALAEEVFVPPSRVAAASPATATSCTQNSPSRRPHHWPISWPGASAPATCPATAPAGSAWSASPAGRPPSLMFLLEELTANARRPTLRLARLLIPPRRTPATDEALSSHEAVPLLDR